ncbi:Sterol regulatory element-binding protein cleavage-activating protein [Elsinoe australis]|uniref:Sterol regulatory element-binding protein cleavage-activating protein n=1 Tax=Elsinoe australis TaxID=40998 RepID=A0A2P8A4V7_9PEZI|nr:Sterol regulatory element-binding protein cleavage-activating protein [Elsinoe australis]
MLASVAIGVIFSYPTVFMSDFPSGAIGGLPHHVWTGSISFESRTEKQPDLEMRQVWLQGDYMQALNKSLLKHAFALEGLLSPNDLDQTSPLSASSAWGIQSPSVYWNHSLGLFESDPDPLRTLGTSDQNLSLLGFELQPLSAFAGKKFSHGKLVGADALIVTLVNRQNASIGERWRKSLIDLSSNAPSHWSVGKPPASSSVYQYKFQPFGLKQYWALIGAYLCMVVYVAVCLNRLKAFHSRTGLVVTAVTQMTTSILASFTICGLLKINLDQIPPESYPFVVLAIGLENIFRLINAVLAYPPEMATNQRIANGVADIGASSLVSAVQNLALLWILSLFVSPGVAAFCAFASIALLFDFFFLITFFLAVLNVDIKRLELQDSLVRSKGVAATLSIPSSSVRTGKPKQQRDRKPWIDALVRGRVPVSTRMAGSAITVTFVLALNWHFSDRSISALRTSPWSSPIRNKYLPTFGSDHPQRPVNRTLNPASWIRSRPSSVSAATQFMHVIKPGVQSFTARIFDPMVIVLDQADRTSVPASQETFLQALRGLAIRHFYPFSLAVVFVVAFVTVLMNFLLWDERTEKPETEMSTIDDGHLSCKTVETSHTLDIVRLAASHCGRILSVGLDRTLGLAIMDRTTLNYTKTNVEYSFIAVDSDTTVSEINWPVDACAVDPQSDDYAVLCRDGSVLIGKTTESALSRVATANINQVTQKVILFDFVSSTTAEGRNSSPVLLLNDGTLFQYSDQQDSFVQSHLDNEEGDLIAASPIANAEGLLDIVVLTCLGSVFKYSWNSNYSSWLSNTLNSDTARPNIAAPSVHEAWLYPVSQLGLLLLCTPQEVALIDLASIASTMTISIGNAKRNSLRVLHAATGQCSQCNATACSNISIAYTDAMNGELVLLNYNLSGNRESIDSTRSSPSTSETTATSPICLSPTTKTCPTLSSITPITTRLKSPGAWEATSSLCIAGLRRTTPSHLPDLTLPSKTTSSTISTSAAKARGLPSKSDSPLRRRRRVSASEYAAAQTEDWEAYIYTHLGSLYTIPVRELGTDSSDSQLFADAPGCVARLSRESVGVAVGNCVVVIKVNGNPDWDGDVGGGNEGRRSGGFERMMEGGREALKGQVGVRRSASRGKRGGAAGLGALGMSRKRVKE